MKAPAKKPRAKRPESVVAGETPPASTPTDNALSVDAPPVTQLIENIPMFPLPATAAEADAAAVAGNGSKLQEALREVDRLWIKVSDLRQVMNHRRKVVRSAIGFTGASYGAHENPGVRFAKIRSLLLSISDTVDDLEPESEFGPLSNVPSHLRSAK